MWRLGRTHHWWRTSAREVEIVTRLRWFEGILAAAWIAYTVLLPLFASLRTARLGALLAPSFLVLAILGQRVGGRGSRGRRGFSGREVALAMVDIAEKAPRIRRVVVAGHERDELRDLARAWKASTARRGGGAALAVPGAVGRALRVGALT